MLHDGSRNRKDSEGGNRRNIGLQDGKRTDTGNPHHGGRGVADDASRATGVRCRDNRGEIADMDLALKDVPRHRAADQRRGDIVEDARQMKTIASSATPPFQSSGSNAGISSGTRLFSK